jgi:RNA polymerase sigma-70 factor (ECF subfamily)
MRRVHNLGGQWLDSLSDEQLVSLSQEGNVQAFNRLTARWEASVYRFSLRVLGNSEDARDVCQEALVKAYLNIKGLRDGSKFRPWVHHIALNLCRDRHRSLGSRAETRPFEEEGIEERRVAFERAGEWSPEDQSDRSRLLRALGEVLTELPMEQRSAILLREYHGFNSEEIGEIVGVPAATVRSRIFYGLRAVRKKLKDRGLS